MKSKLNVTLVAICLIIYLVFITWAITTIKNVILEAKKWVPIECHFSSFNAPYANFEALEASWYSTDHCLGCREDRKMANNQVLDDNKLTVAFNKALINSEVMICTTKLDNCQKATVTDRIGYPGRIDMTPPLFKKFSSLDKGLTDVIVLYNTKELSYGN